MALLEVDGVSKRFGGVTAVKGVSLRVEAGTVKALIGPNGAGKTTLFDLLSGFRAPDSGSIRFRGLRIDGQPPHRRAAMGMSRTFQNLKLFPHMTAEENVMVGRHVRSRAGFWSGLFGTPGTRLEERAIAAAAREAMEFVGVLHLAARLAGGLSYGEQRGIELARALASEPTLLLLDEPAAGLNLRETSELASLIGRIRNRGVTVLVVEHDVSLVMGVADEVAVLSFGEKIADAAPRAVQADPEVVRVYLGE